MDWQDLHYFCVLARLGSLSAAARELGVDHATVGRRVAALEKSLSLRLLDRLPRRALLTPQGRVIASLAADMEVAAGSIGRRAREIGGAAEVRVSAPPALAARLIAPHVGDFHVAHPDITLVLSGASGPAALDQGEADVALRMSPPGDPDLVARKVGTVRFGLYGAASMMDQDPDHWAFVGYDPALDHVTSQRWLRTLLAGRPLVFQASDLFAQQEAARAGLGAVVLPTIIGDADSGLVRLPVPLAPPTRDLWLAVYPDLRKSVSVAEVMDFIVGVVGRTCPLHPVGDAVS